MWTSMACNMLCLFVLLYVLLHYFLFALWRIIWSTVTCVIRSWFWNRKFILVLYAFWCKKVYIFLHFFTSSSFILRESSSVQVTSSIQIKTKNSSSRHEWPTLNDSQKVYIYCLWDSKTGKRAKIAEFASTQHKGESISRNALPVQCSSASLQQTKCSCNCGYLILPVILKHTGK